MAKQPKTINRFRGVNKLDRFSIGEEYAMETKNLTSDMFPALTVRPGLVQLGSAVGDRVLGLGVYKDEELFAAFNDGTIRKWTGTAWSAALKSGLSTTAVWTFTNFKGGLSDINLFGTNGVDTMIRYDGTSISNVSDAPFKANFVTQFADRLWCAKDNELHASAYRDGTDWTTESTPQLDSDSWWTNVETSDGEKINGIKAGLTKLTITKPSSIHHLYNYAPSDYMVNPKTYDFGAFNNKCIEPLKGELHMMDANAISSYDGGVLPDSSFSVKVQEYIDNIDPVAAKVMACIGSDGHKLYVSIPTDNDDYNDTILVYDTRYDTWFVWKGINALHFARIGNKLYIGDASGKVHQITGTSDNGADIEWDWVSPPVTSPMMAKLMRWFDKWITANVKPGSTFNVYISPIDSGDSDWTLVKSLNANGVVETTPIYLAAQPKASNARYLRVKFSGTGPMDLREWTRTEEYSELR